MALADAQQLAIRKLLSKSAYDSTLSPGPPLPKSHPSPALIAKLYLECASLYSSARALAKTPGASRHSKFNLKPRDSDEVNPELRHYLADEAQLSNTLAWKWLGVDAGENGAEEKGGEAVAFLAWAKSELEELKDGRRGVSLDKEKREKRERMKEKVNNELEEVTVFWKNYKKMNDSVHFQPVPPTSALQSLIPAGRSAVALKPFIPPTPAFGPGSVEYVRRQTDLLEMSEGVDTEDSQSGQDRPQISHQASSSSYAGAGSYF